jgi:hypothetical protein
MSNNSKKMLKEIKPYVSCVKNETRKKKFESNKNFMSSLMQIKQINIKGLLPTGASNSREKLKT